EQRQTKTKNLSLAYGDISHKKQQQAASDQAHPRVGGDVTAAAMFVREGLSGRFAMVGIVIITARAEPVVPGGGVDGDRFAVLKQMVLSNAREHHQ
ncbi:unnamed protein product, partial [Pylaiella littoralis]